MLSNIPAFPCGKKLTLADRQEIEDFIHRFEPYSDYDFVSLWTNDIKEDVTISNLYNNLVMKFRDYITNEPFYTFLGNNNTAATIYTLLKHAKDSKNSELKLKLIPEENIKSNPELFKLFDIKEDRDNFDYILSVRELNELKGNKYSPKKNFVKRFLSHHPNHTVKVLDLENQETKDQILNLFYLWEQQKGQTREETIHELTAIQRLLGNASNFHLLSLGIYDKEQLIAFSINEVINNDYSTILYEKANIDYIGIYQYLKQITAKFLDEQGVAYINYEQDLAIEGLRKAKESWRPVKFLKKYIIDKKAD